jgi:hypothetical protein
MSGGGTATTCTLRGTAVPTLTAKLTLLTRGTLLPVNTVCRTSVRCSAMSKNSQPDALDIGEPHRAVETS